MLELEENKKDDHPTAGACDRFTGLFVSVVIGH